MNEEADPWSATHEPLHMHIVPQEFDAQAIAIEMKKRFGVIAAAVVVRDDETSVHYVGGETELEGGIERAVELLMEEWEWPTRNTTHQWYDPRLPLAPVFL